MLSLTIPIPAWVIPEPANPGRSEQYPRWPAGPVPPNCYPV